MPWGVRQLGGALRSREVLRGRGFAAFCGEVVVWGKEESQLF